MPDRHRPYRAIARGIACVVACVLLSAATGNQPQRNGAPQNANQQRQTNVQARPAPLLPPVVQTDIDRVARALEAANASRNPAKEDQRTEENLQAQKDIAFWGRWVAYAAVFETGVTFLGVLLVAFTLAATRRAATAATNQVTESRNAAARDLRPYVSLSVTARRWPNQLVAGAGLQTYHWDRYSLLLIIKNAGKTWAQNVRVQFAQVPNASGDAWTGHVNWSVAARPPLVIAPGEEVSLQFGDDIARSRLPRIRDGQEMVFFAAWVIYDDPITDPPTQRQTRLYRVLNADREENVSFTYMATNNCADDSCA